ncbi:MAG: GNAT family N-acetyltransferase [Candidatus Nanopelagicales bacterium]|nr:GNAT family N-acetyltransferase [Candidatus Nanopelagicales bacterium]
MTVTIRAIEEKDKNQWLNLWAGYLEFYKSTISTEQTELTWKRLINNELKMFGFVAENEEGVIGFTHCLFRPSTWTETDYCYLEDLFVDPLIRGKGVGRALMDKVFELAREKKSKRVYWTTQEFNKTARVLYDSITPVSEYVQYRLPIIIES